MTWHHTTTTKPELHGVLSDIRHQGGTIASCQQCTGGLLVTWFTL